MADMVNIDYTNLIIGSLISIAISFFIYFLEKRRATSTEKERIKRINEDIEDLILRESVRGKRIFELEEIEALLTSQSRANDINIELLESPEEIISDVYFKILDNEYIYQDYKVKILENVKKMLKDIKIRTKKRGEKEEVSVSPSPLIAIISFLVMITSLILIMPFQVFNISGLILLPILAIISYYFFKAVMRHISG
jgi:hypothetical protein